MKTINLNLEDDEIAVAVPDYAGRYVITSLGKVYSLIRDKWLKGGPGGPGGYLFVGLRDGHSTKYIQIHKLVARAFEIPGWDNPDLEVDHINGDVTDNRLVNLQMLTHEQNLAKRDREKMKRSKRNSKYERTRSKAVVKIESCEFYWSQNIAAESIGRPGKSSDIGRCCRGIQHTAYGYHWRYATESEILEHS